MLNDKLQKLILEHAEKEYPKESCGLIVKKGRVKSYIPMVNSSTENQQDHFLIKAEDYTKVEDSYDEILAVVHSHPDATTQPSLRDRAVCTSMEIPWVICSWPDADIRIITPENAPLVGRPFVHGTDWDCYGLIRDYYKEKLDINLSRYPHDSYWWEDGGNYYEDYYENEGFVKVTDGSIREHDLIIMQIRSKVPNHGAIYIGHSQIMHHTFGRPSSIAVYGGYWKEHTNFILRHESLC